MANDDLPSWGKTIASAAAFVAVMVASQSTIVWLLTGEWGGTQHDPLWVGPVSAGLAMVNAIGTCVAAVLTADSWKAEEIDG